MLYILNDHHICIYTTPHFFRLFSVAQIPGGYGSKVKHGYSKNDQPRCGCKLLFDQQSYPQSNTTRWTIPCLVPWFFQLYLHWVLGFSIAMFDYQRVWITTISLLLDAHFFCFRVSTFAFDDTSALGTSSDFEKVVLWPNGVWHWHHHYQHQQLQHQW